MIYKSAKIEEICERLLDSEYSEYDLIRKTAGQLLGLVDGAIKPKVALNDP